MIYQNGSAAPRILSPQNEALQQHFISLVSKIDDHIPCGEFGERLVGVIGAQAGQGVSSIAMNLALAAAQVERRNVLLVDANHDRPRSEQLFGVRRSPGFTDLLDGASDAESCLQPVDEHALSVISVGSQRTGRHDRHRLATSIQELREQAAWTIFDIGPADGISDGVNVAAQLDGALVVVRAKTVGGDVVQKAVNRLRAVDCKLIGIVMNEHGRL